MLIDLHITLNPNISITTDIHAHTQNHKENYSITSTTTHSPTKCIMGHTKDEADRKRKSDKSPSGKIGPDKSLTPVLGTPPQNSVDDNVGILSAWGTGTDNKLPQSDIGINNNVAVPTGEKSDNINNTLKGGNTATDNNLTLVNKHPPGILFGVDIGVPSGETNLTKDNVDNT